MARREFLSTAALLAVGMAIAGCASGSDGATATPASTSQSPQGGQGTTPRGTASPTATPVTGQDVFGDGVDELRDGVWQLGDAGEIEFALKEGALALIEVRPADGWQQRVSDDDADEIEVHFTRGSTDWKLEVEIDDSTMEISKELRIKLADGGTYQAGSAGEVSFTSNGTTVTLGEVSPSPGWTVAEQDVSSDDIEIEFRNDSGGKAELEVEARGGSVEVEISQKLSGPIPA